MKAKKVLVAAVAASLTLGCVAGFAGCASKSETGDFKELSMTDAYETKAAKSYEYEAKSISDLDGYTYYSNYNVENLRAFVKTDVDANGNTTGTIKMYDMVKGETVLTLAAYSYSSTTLATTVVRKDVEFIVCNSKVCGYIVKTTTEKTPAGGTATTEVSYSICSVGSTTVLATADQLTGTSFSGSFSRGTISTISLEKTAVKSFGFDGKYFAYDSESESLVATTEPDKFAKYNTAADMTKVEGNYGYVKVNNTLSIYNVSGNVVGEKYADYELPESDTVQWFVLANGNVLVQTLDYLSTSSTDYDMYYTYNSDSVNANYDHYVYNLEKKKASKVTMNYLVSDVYANTEDGTYEELYNDEIENVVTAYKIVDGQYNPSDSTTRVMLSVTNDGKTKGELPLSSKDNGMFTSLGGDKYMDGSYYLYTYADEELKEVGYIGGADESNSTYLVYGDEIYDYNLSKVRTLTEDETCVLTSDGVLIGNSETGKITYLDASGKESTIVAANSTTDSIEDYDTNLYIIKTETTGDNATTTYTLKDYNGTTLASVTKGADNDGIEELDRATDDDGNTVYLFAATQTDKTTSETTTTYYRVSMKAE